MKKLILTIGILVILLSVSLFYYLSHDKWKRYIQKTIYQPPRALLVEALVELEPIEWASKNAIDLGAGAGNETAYLLQKGWQVWAIDASSTAVEIIAGRHDIKNKTLLHAIRENFTDIDWAILPKMDLIVAISSLSFCEPSQFGMVWRRVVDQIKPGGYFVGNFFGPQFVGFNEKEKKQMTWLQEDQVKRLFEDFSIVLFREINQPSESATGVKTHEHMFEVVARKTISTSL